MRPLSVCLFMAIILCMVGGVVLQDAELDLAKLEEEGEQFQWEMLCASAEFLGTYTVTAYNSVRAQCDATPNWTASGYYIMGEDKIVASNFLPFGTQLLIDGEVWVVEDRMAKRFPHRIDLHFGKDVQKARNWGIQQKKVWRLN